MPWEREGSGYRKKGGGGFVRNPRQYEKLRRMGMSKQRAAAITNSDNVSKAGGQLVRTGFRHAAEDVGRGMGPSARAAQGKDGAYKIFTDHVPPRQRRKISVKATPAGVFVAGGAAGGAAAGASVRGDKSVKKGFQPAKKAERKTFTRRQQEHVVRRQQNGGLQGMGAGAATGAAVGAALGRGDRKLGATLGAWGGLAAGEVAGERQGYKRGVTEVRNQRSRVRKDGHMISAFGVDHGISKSAPARDVSTKARAKAAAKGDALPDGSFPIQNRAQLKRAREAVGRSKHPAEARALIRRRAKDLDVSLKGSSIQKGVRQVARGARLAGEAAAVGYGAAKAEPHVRRELRRRQEVKKGANAFGVVHPVSKASQKPPSAGRVVAGTLLGVPHAAVAAKKGQKLAAAGSSAGHIVAGDVAGALAGARLGGETGAVLGSSLGTLAGSARSVYSNQAKGRFKRES